MSHEHVISDEVLDKATRALLKGENWMVYNNSLYFIEPNEVEFFQTKEDAEEFCESNYSDHDCFCTLYVRSPEDLIKQVPYGESLSNYLNSTFTIHIQKNLDQLKNDLTRLGFSERLFSALEFYLKSSPQHFQLFERERSQKEKMCYELAFEKSLDTNEYRLADYKASLRIYPDIPDITIQGINAKELDKTMQTVDWSIDHHTENLFYENTKTQEGCELLDKIDGILKDINRLYEDEGMGKDAAERLMYKHWFGEPWEPNSFSLGHVRQQYEWNCHININQHGFQTKSETYTQLKAAALKDLEQVNKHLITEKNFVMNEKNYEYLADQLKKTGFGETLNNEIREKMMQQTPEFTINLQTTFGKDDVRATLHFKRSEQSDMVFFNKYHLQLKKENDEKGLQQAFYVNKGNTITLKEGYNLLDGRAVYKTLTNQQNEKYNAWLKLDLNKPSESGNYKMQYYHQNYGFDLEKTLAKYPIQELSNEKFKESLIKSLQKGNLQSATFLINGKEEKMYITPNLSFQSLNAYDSKMKKVSLSTLTQKKMPEQKQSQENKQELSEKPQEKKQNKIKNDDAGKSMRKQGRKQKVG